MKSQKDYISVVAISLVVLLSACGVPQNPRIVLSQLTAIPVTITDTIRIAPPIQMADSSMSNFNPIITEEALYFPTTSLDGSASPDQFGNPPGRTGITAIDAGTMDTLWVSQAGTTSGERWPLIGSLAQFQDSLILISFEDGIYQFSMADGSFRTAAYSEQMQYACRRIRDVRGDWFSSLDFVSDGERIAYRLYPVEYNRESNRLYDIVVTDKYMEEQCIYTLHYYVDRIIEIEGKSYSYEGTVSDYLLTDSSLCFHTVEPELFFEIGFDGNLIRNLFLGDQELSGPVLPLASPYQGSTTNTQSINRCIVLNDGHLYTLRTGLSTNGTSGAGIIDTNLETNTAIFYQLDSTLGWTKFSGNGSLFIADWFEVPAPNEDGLYEWTGKDHYALIRLQ
jgi:hypothetical protein